MDLGQRQGLPGVTLRCRPDRHLRPFPSQSGSRVTKSTRLAALGASFKTHLQIFSDFMTIRNDTHPEAPRDQVLTAAVENDSEKTPDNPSTEKVEAQSMSYRRSRNVALMKLAFLRPEDNEAP